MEILTQNQKDYLNRIFAKTWDKPEPEVSFKELEKAANLILRDIATLNRMKKRHESDVAEIEAKRKVYAAEVVNRELAEAEANHTEQVKRFAGELLGAVDYVRENIGELTRNKPFDLAGQEFQSILATITASGAHLPPEMQLAFIRKFQDNKAALSLLRGVYKNNGYTSAAVEEAFREAENTINMQPLDNIAEAAAFAQYRGSWSAPHLEDVKAVWNFGVKYGLNLMENPMITELKGMAAKHENAAEIVNRAVKEIQSVEDTDPEAANKIYQEAVYRIMAGAQE